MKQKFKLYQLSFNGEYVLDSEHDTIEEAEETSADLGSKWVFYPWSVIVKGKTIVEFCGCFINLKTKIPILDEIFKGKRFTTACKAFNKASKQKELESADCYEFEDYLINKLRK